MEASNEKVRVVVTRPTKSMGIGIALTFFFGPLGMFYSTIVGAVVMLVISIIVGLLTVGIGLLFLWPIQIIWTIIAVSSYNKKLLSGEI